jgi:hypothetical protein
MRSTVSWQDEKYREVFEGIVRGLDRRRALDPDFALADAEGMLAHLYVLEGNNQLGRGKPDEISLEATISAYEHYIAEWKNGKR